MKNTKKGKKVRTAALNNFMSFDVATTNAQPAATTSPVHPLKQKKKPQNRTESSAKIEKKNKLCTRNNGND